MSPLEVPADWDVGSPGSRLSELVFLPVGGSWRHFWWNFFQGEMHKLVTSWALPGPSAALFHLPRVLDTTLFGSPDLSFAWLSASDMTHATLAIYSMSDTLTWLMFQKPQWHCAIYTHVYTPVSLLLPGFPVDLEQGKRERDRERQMLIQLHHYM